jgi:GntR family transcriptional regulator
MAKQPMYLQIAEDLRRQIELGNLEGQVPTEHDLREKYGVSRNTVRDAIARLTEMHLVEATPGKGTFVTKPVEPFVTDLSPLQGDGGEESRTYPDQVKEQNRDKEGVAGRPTVYSSQCPSEVAALLGITPDTEVIVRAQERYVDRDLWSVQTSYYPRKWYEDGAVRLLIAENIEEGTLQYLESVVSLKQVRYEDWITARPAKEDEPTRFGLPHNAAMFLIYRTGFTSDGTAIRVTVTLYPADRNQFRYRFDTLPS